MHQQPKPSLPTRQGAWGGGRRSQPNAPSPDRIAVLAAISMTWFTAADPGGEPHAAAMTDQGQGRFLNAKQRAKRNAIATDAPAVGYGAAVQIAGCFADA
eukprot:366571-Chlamydomonas_euryale.AAC.15